MRQDKALSKALKLLSFKDYSERELSILLSRRFAGEDVAEVLERLRALGYIDDNLLAGRLVHRYLEKARGFHYIIDVLKRRAFSPESIEEAVKNFDYEKEYAAARRYINKNSGKKSLQSLKFGLRSRGFSGSSAARALRYIQEEGGD